MDFSAHSFALGVAQKIDSQLLGFSVTGFSITNVCCGIGKALLRNKKGGCSTE
jgi:hypothetical protein